MGKARPTSRGPEGSRRHPSEVPSQGAVRKEAAGPRADPAGSVPPEGSRACGGEGNAGPHPHELSVPRRPSIALTIESLKGTSATRIHRELWPTKGVLFGRISWARGYRVSPVGRDEDQIRRSIREQEKLRRDQDRGELNLD